MMFNAKEKSRKSANNKESIKGVKQLTRLENHEQGDAKLVKTNKCKAMQNW